MEDNIKISIKEYDRLLDIEKKYKQIQGIIKFDLMVKNPKLIGVI